MNKENGDRLFPIKKIPDNRLVINEMTRVSFVLEEGKEMLLFDNRQEQSGGRLVRKFVQANYKKITNDSHGDIGPIGY